MGEGEDELHGDIMEVTENSHPDVVRKPCEVVLTPLGLQERVTLPLRGGHPPVSHALEVLVHSSTEFIPLVLGMLRA